MPFTRVDIVSTAMVHNGIISDDNENYYDAGPYDEQRYDVDIDFDEVAITSS